MSQHFAEKQLKFILESTRRWNIAHGSVSTGKTVCTSFRFLEMIDQCPDNEIAMIGKTSTTIYNNVIKLIFETPELSIFRPFCTWSPSRRELKYKNKTITTYGAKDEGSTQLIQGRSLSLAYCDEMTLYTDSFIHMLDTRLRKPHSMAIASMNPTYPGHIIKSWIDKAQAGDPNYYEMHFTLEDNPFLPKDYKERIKNSLTGLSYKRNYLGLWCVAEGAIFDFFDRDIHVLKKPPCAAEYFIASIDYGISNAFACVIIGVSTGKYTQSSKKLWVEKEYYWDCKVKGRQKINSEFANDMQDFLEPYGVRAIYIDPSALAMKLELQRRGMHIVEANNDVQYGIETMCSEMAKGNLYVLDSCPNLIREIEGYIWDEKKSAQGDDAPVKKSDHAVDAMRYALATHKVTTYDPFKDQQGRDEWFKNRFDPGSRRF